MSKKKDVKEIPVKKSFNFQLSKKIILIVILVVLSINVYCNFELLSWHISAVGRISLAKLLPYWNWQRLYNTKCLVAKESSEIKDSGDSFPLDCGVCEGLASNVTRTSNLTFKKLQDNFLLRGMPVIISDSHTPWLSDFNFLNELLHIDDFMTSDPCNVKSNLAMRQWMKLRKMLESIQENSGFLHFRNCEFGALKATRRLYEKPYFYLSHLEPPHSTWFLVSHNFTSFRETRLNVVDLVVVQQMKGNVELALEGKEDCFEECGKFVETLVEGESLVFISELWNLRYKPVEANFSVTIVTETYWKY